MIKEKISMKEPSTLISPLFDRILLEPILETQSQNGILIPKTAKEKTQLMKVVALGKETKSKLYVGEKVIIHRYAGTDFSIGDKSYFIIKECDILAVLS